MTLELALIEPLEYFGFQILPGTRRARGDVLWGVPVYWLLSVVNKVGFPAIGWNLQHQEVIALHCRQITVL